LKEELSKRLSTNLGFVEFLDYFGRFSILYCGGGSIRKLIQPPQKESKSGSKEPKNRQKPKFVDSL